MKIKLDENNRVIGFCTFGELEGSIEIKDFKFEHDPYDYVYKKEKIEYEPDIKRYKEKKRLELKAIRDEKIHKDITVHGAVFQVRPQDKEHFDDAERAVTRGAKKGTDKRNWILEDNSVQAFTYEQIRQVLDAKAERKERIFQKFGELSMKLAYAETIEDVEKIKWED